MLKRGSLLSKAAAIGLLLSVIGVSYSLLVLPVMRDYRDYRAQIDQSRQLIARYEARQTNVQSLEGRIKQLRSDRSFSSAFLKGQNPSLAAANLQGRIGRLVQSLNGKLTSAQSIPERGKERFQRVVVRTQVVLTTDAMRRLLYTLESARPYLFLDNVVVRKAPNVTRRYRRTARRGAQSQARALPEEVDQLDVRFDVYGYLWQGKQT